MKNKIFAALNVLGVIALLIGMVRYMALGGLALKATAAGCFVALGVMNMVYALVSKPPRRRYAVIMSLGLLFAMLGDVLLGKDLLKFAIGAGLFAVGHILYTVSYYTLKRVTKWDIIVSGIMFAFSTALILFYPKFDFGGFAMQAVCLVYGLVISCMVGKAVPMWIQEKSVRNALIALGSMLFYFSDLMLVLRFFADAPYFCDRLCLGTYFPAQGLLALAVFFHVRKGAIKE